MEHLIKRASGCGRSPTKAFPHPMAQMPYDHRITLDNARSYMVVDEIMWMGVRDMINELREQHLGLDPLRTGERGGMMLHSNRVPFAKMWSPSFVPKPEDWGPMIDVVGNFFSPLPPADAPPPQGDFHRDSSLCLVISC
jgi:sterol 3beta-glucosyltransferase